MSSVIELTINGATRRVETAPARPLLDVLREDLGLTGCKVGCGEGACGACTVLVGSQPTRACVTAVGDVAGQPILTIEGLASLTRQGDKACPEPSRRETRGSEEMGRGEPEPQPPTPNSQPPRFPQPPAHPAPETPARYSG